MRRLFSRYSLYFFLLWDFILFSFDGSVAFLFALCISQAFVCGPQPLSGAVNRSLQVSCDSGLRWLGSCWLRSRGCDCLSSCGGGLGCWSQHSVRLATAFRWASCGSSLRPYATLSFYHSLPCFCCFSLAITTWFSSDTLSFWLF